MLVDSWGISRHWNIIFDKYVTLGLKIIVQESGRETQINQEGKLECCLFVQAS